MAGLTHILDHAAQALARLIAQYRGKPKIEGLVTVPGTRAQTVEDVAWDLVTKRLSIDSAFGVQLDGIGKITKRPRLGLDDTAYRQQLKAQIKIILGSGTIPELLAIFSLLVTDGRTLKLLEQFPAAIVLRLETAASTDYDVLYQILQTAKAGGVRAILEWLNSTPGNAFTLDTGPGFDVGVMGNAE